MLLRKAISEYRKLRRLSFTLTLNHTISYNDIGLCNLYLVFVAVEMIEKYSPDHSSMTFTCNLVSLRI